MSLINQMLRDLEQRNQQTPSVKPALPLDIQMPSVVAKSGNRYGWWLAGLLTSAAAGGLFWQSPQMPSASTASPQPAITPVEAKPVEPIPAATAAPESAPTQLTAAETTREPPAPETDISKPELQANSQPVATANPELPKPASANPQQKPASEATPKTAKAPSSKQPQQQAEALYRQINPNMSRAMRQEKLEDVLQLDPRNLAARQQLLQILIQDHANLELKQFLEDSLAWFPDNLGFITTLAHYHVQQKNFAEAVSTLERVDSFRINDPHYLALLAASYQQQQQLTEALPVYQKLTQLQPEKAEHWLGLGICADKLQQTSSALAAYQQALNKNTLNHEVVDYINQRLSALTR